MVDPAGGQKVKQLWRYSPLFERRCTTKVIVAHFGLLTGRVELMKFYVLSSWSGCCLAVCLALAGSLFADGRCFANNRPFADAPSTQQESKLDEGEVETIQPFELAAIDGQDCGIKPANETHFTVVCFTGNECPLARLYVPRLKMIALEFTDSPVSFLAINSNRQDSLDEMESFATSFDLPFPLARDEGNVVADNFLSLIHI